MSNLLKSLAKLDPTYMTHMKLFGKKKKQPWAVATPYTGPGMAPPPMQMPSLYGEDSITPSPYHFLGGGQEPIKPFNSPFAGETAQAIRPLNPPPGVNQPGANGGLLFEARKRLMGGAFPRKW